jgi:hypothetical protein
MKSLLLKLSFLICILLFININTFAQAPSIDVWYGNSQKFGHLGIPQDQINILGRVSDPQGTNTITTFHYSLNGSSTRGLNIGPDTRRLLREGDFNIEIFPDDVNLNSTAPFPTVNTVIITAIDEDTNTSLDTVVFEYTNDVVWNSPYSIDWDTVTNIQNVVQVTDGQWEIVTYDINETGIRVDSNAYGYDRAVILGEQTWENYEVVVKAKIVQGYPIDGGVAAGAFLGFVPRWTGHTDSPPGASGFDPKSGWEPSGEFIGYSYLNPYDNNFYKLGEIDQTAIIVPETNTEYYKLRLQSDLGQNYYAFKHWLTTESEPGEWTLDGFIDNTLDAEQGSVLLLAHNVDAIFGDITISPLSPLPVELVSFEAVVENKGSVLLTWSTATELNNFGFEIERAASEKKNQNIDWKKIAFINGHGNSSSTHYYSYTDKPNSVDKYYYRLKQIDNDGTFEYSKIVEASITTPSDYSLTQNYPNPFNPATAINFSLPEESRVTLTVFDALGQTVSVLKNEILSAGKHNAVFNAENISSGTYIYVLSGTSAASQKTFRLVKKMTVIK